MDGSHQVAIVELNSGADIAVFLDGRYVLDAALGAGDSEVPVRTTARSLAQIHGCEIETVRWAPEGEEWMWNEVRDFLVASGTLKRRSPGS